MTRSDLLTDDDLATKRAPAKEPSRAWRNKWRANFHGRCMYCGHVSSPGEEFWGCITHPSRDVAETQAARCIELDFKDHGKRDEYLGAYPTDET